MAPITVCVVFFGFAYGGSLSYHSATFHHVLNGFRYQAGVLDNYEQCYRWCQYEIRCKSINWFLETKVCELNEQVAAITIAFSRGVLHVSVQETVVGNACGTTSCDHGHTCIPVTSSQSYICGYSRPSETQTQASTSTLTTASPTTTTTISTSTTTTATSTTTTLSTTSATITTTTTTTTISTTTSSTTTTTTSTTPTAPYDCEEFLLMAGHYIAYNDPKELRDATPESCKAFCIAEKDFDCRSFDYSASMGKCWFTDVVKDDVLDMWRQDGNYDYYQRLDVTPPLGEEFEVVQSHVIKQNNLVSHYSVSTVVQCKILCLEAEDFVCRSFDFFADNVTCHLANVTKDDVPQFFIYDERSVYYERLTVCDKK